MTLNILQLHLHFTFYSSADQGMGYKTHLKSYEFRFGFKSHSGGSGKLEIKACLKWDLDNLIKEKDSLRNLTRNTKPYFLVRLVEF